MKKEIVDLEERLRVAMLNSNTDELNELLSGELLFTNHLGALISKEEDLKAHFNREFEFTSLELSELKVVSQEKNVVVSVKAEIKGYYNGKAANSNFRFTRVWSKYNDRWQVIAGHSSVIA